MNDRFELVVDELRGHADRLRGISDQLDQALNAARQVSMSDQAYGQICTFFPPIVHLVTQAGIESLAEAVTSVGETVQGVRETAVGYDTVDDGNASALRGGLS
jgi:hypothetical protein